MPSSVPNQPKINVCHFAGGLHSYRFVEVLSFGCIPVLLSDDWVPPFVELVDFSGERASAVYMNIVS